LIISVLKIVQLYFIPNHSTLGFLCISTGTLTHIHALRGEGVLLDQRPFL